MRAASWTVLGFLGLWLGGCGDSNSGNHSTTSAGAPGSGGSSGTGGSSGSSGIGGGSSGTGGGSSGSAGSMSSGGDAALTDPPAAEPDLTGLVTTSAKWLLVSEASSVVVGASLDFVDLESGMHYPANPANLPVAFSYWSPDQKSFVFSGADADSDKNLTIVRLTKNGFVPGKLIEGFEGTRGSFAFPKWDESSRFFTAARGGSMTDGVEVVDSVLGKRLGHVDFPPSFSHSFAPQGLYFGWSHGDAVMREVGLARVVADGISAPTMLPEGSYMPIFSNDGTRAFFGRSETEVIHQYYLDLPGTTPKEILIAGEGEKLNGAASPGPNSDSVLAYVQKADTDRQYVQAFVDARPRVVLSDPAKKVRFQFESDDHNIHAVDYETSLDIVRVEPYLRLPLPGVTIMDAQQYWTTGVVGQHVYHQVDGQLFVASIDAGGALSDVAVSAPGEPVSVCEFYGSHEPTTKLAYRTVKDDVAQVVVVDLAANPPAVSGRVTASAAGHGLYCPDFSADETAMVVSETSETAGKIYGVKWTNGLASEPEVLLEAESSLLVRAFSY